MAMFKERAGDEPCAKRVRLDDGEDVEGGCRSVSTPGTLGGCDGPRRLLSEAGVLGDSDSGCEASTPSHVESPHVDLNDSILMENLQQNELDTSQDSLELDDDNASTVSHLSDISGLSDLSGKGWKPMVGNMVWIRKQMQNGIDPRTLLQALGAELGQIPEHLDDVTLWKIIINMMAEPPRRHKLRHVNSLVDVVRLLKGAKNIVVLTGAGVSVSCGIPDFRSRDGIYSRLAADFPDLPDPQAMFDINYFNQDPRPFFKFAKDIYPGKFQPSPSHRFIRLIEKNRKLLRNYTQNIDTLEKAAGIERVVECHGSFATATCTKCGHKVTAEEIQETVLLQRIPLCTRCHVDDRSYVDSLEVSNPEDLRDLVKSGIMKPDIVFFGEGLPDAFHEAMVDDKNNCDLLLVIGSSLKVRPVALIPNSLPSHIPQLLINREPLPHCHFDVELLGDCDVIVNHLCQLLEDSWEEGVVNPVRLNETLQLLPPEQDSLPNFSGKFETAAQQFPVHVENDKSCTCTSTNSNSCMTVLESEENSCSCYIKKSESELYMKIGKERHMSVDSARDSGIGENSNFTDVEVSSEMSMSRTEESSNHEPSVVDLRGFWQPKIKKSLVDRLPAGTFYLISPSRYIFPGAELFYDPDEKYSYLDTSSSDSSDSESENEEAY